MATVVGMIGAGSSSSSSWIQSKDRKKRSNNNTRLNKISCVSSSYSAISSDPYKTLRINPGASETEVRKAFRQLALQYHPDVCRGSNCGIQFHQINEAYDTVMSNLRDESTASAMDMYGGPSDAGIDEPMRGMNEDWDMWEEWMGWEGAGIRDYTSHINPYI